YLPTRASLTAENAPPPLNPSLQYCLEEFVHEEFRDNGDTIRAAIDRMAGVEISYLPEDLREELEDGLDSARETFDHMAEIRSVQDRLAAGAVDYRPVHRVVRALQRDARQLDVEIDRLQTRIQRALGDQGVISAAEQEIATLEEERDALLAQVPDDWTSVQDTYVGITRDDRTARNAYRRAADAAYEPVSELIAVLADTDALIALREPLEALNAQYRSVSGEAAEELFRPVESLIGEVEGARDIRSGVSGARRDIDDDTPNYEDADGEMAEALEAFEREVAWRTQAVEAGLPAALAEYQAAISDTIGLRQQPRLPQRQALFVASCSSGHRDISLNF
ncbi:MAG: C4-dicarboxylate ABC transporter permease, partial [Pseudomonadota bacterium]